MDSQQQWRRRYLQNLAAEPTGSCSTAFMCVVSFPGSATAWRRFSRCSAVGRSHWVAHVKTQPVNAPFPGVEAG